MLLLLLFALVLVLVLLWHWRWCWCWLFMLVAVPVWIGADVRIGAGICGCGGLLARVAAIFGFSAYPAAGMVDYRRHPPPVLLAARTKDVSALKPTERCFRLVS